MPVGCCRVTTSRRVSAVAEVVGQQDALPAETMMAANQIGAREMRPFRGLQAEEQVDATAEQAHHGDGDGQRGGLSRSR